MLNINSYVFMMPIEKIFYNIFKIKILEVIHSVELRNI